MKRVNSGGPSNVSSVSVYKAGNIYAVTRHVEDLEDEDLSDNDIEVDEVEPGKDVNVEPLSPDDYKRADELMSEVFGVPIIEQFARLILNKEMKPRDIVVQSLVYQIMKRIRGSSGVRYQDSYGMFWAGVREASKIKIARRTTGAKC